MRRRSPLSGWPRWVTLPLATDWFSPAEIEAQMSARGEIVRYDWLCLLSEAVDVWAWEAGRDAAAVDVGYPRWPVPDDVDQCEGGPPAELVARFRAGIEKRHRR